MSKLIDELYQEMHGFKVLKRDYVAKGQSKFYYLDPRYDGEDRRSQINVSDENIPNPRMGAILADDLHENPQNYYIWRTCKDDKVRGKHAEREGKIFNKHIPPEGGNPGEDYNCRCWAEPYDEQEYKNKPMVIDVSGLDIFKELKPVDFTTEGLPQYAANDKSNTTSDAVYKKYDNSILTEEKFQDIITFLRKDYIEGFANFPYLDSVGKDTVCTGHLITEKEQYSLPYYMADTGKPATKAEIKKEMDKLHQYTEYQKNAAENLKHNKNSKDKPYIAGFFKNVTKLRLTDAQCDAIDRKIIETKWNELVEQFPNFTIMDWNLQRAIFDVHYQCDVLKKKKSTDINWNSKDEFKEYKWPKLLNAAKNKNIPQMAEHIHVIQSSSERNNAKINWVLNGKFYY